LLIALVVTTTAIAAEAEDIIKYRQGVMKSVGGHMAAAAQIVRGKVEYADDLVYHAESIARAMQTVESLFPEDSDFGETRALDAIWYQAEKFKTVSDEARTATSAFRDTVKANDKAAFAAKFKLVTDSCKACHKDFRAEKEQ
jgi:cytochrome c556